MSGPAPEEAEILDFQNRCDAFYPPDAVSAPVERQRRWYDALCAAFDPGRPAGVAVEDRPLGGVPARFYRPAPVSAGATILYLHGGGFVVGSLDSHDAVCAELAQGTGAELVAIDYRLAPEHRWPAAFDDGWAALSVLLAQDRSVVLAGDSAGGNLAAGLAVRARDAGASGIRGLALVYPGLGGDLASGSYAEMAEAPGLSTADVRYYRDLYAAPETDPVAHPLRAESLAGLPPTFVSAARFDPLRDDARLFAGRLALAGVDVSFREEPQMIHAWLRARHTSPGARAGFAALVRELSRLARLT